MVSHNTENSNRALTAVMLAGTLRPSPLRRALNRPVLCLPLGNGETVLDMWLRILDEVGGLDDTRIVCNRSSDVDAMAAALQEQFNKPEPHPITNAARGLENGSHQVRALAEPASWRGAGGVLRDATRDLDPDRIVLVLESSALPPATLVPVVQKMQRDAAIVGLVGICGVDEPAGVFAFRARAFDCVPPVGYFDLKEQLLPALAKQGDLVCTVRFGSELVRLRDREEYLAAVRTSGASGCESADGKVRIHPNAEVSHSAVFAGGVVIEAQAVIEDGAVVHDSVVLRGACIGGGAVVSESVIGPGATILPRRRVVREIVPPTPAPALARESRNGIGRIRLRPSVLGRERIRT